MDIYLSNISQLESKFATLPDDLNGALLSRSQTVADALVQKVQDNLSGAVLAEKTGLLRNSIQSDVQGSSSGTSASVSVGDDVPYAAIQEYGGVTKAHVIEAMNARALAFSFGGKQAFFRRVNHPGSDIPERSYLRSALADMQDDIVDGMAEAVSAILR